MTLLLETLSPINQASYVTEYTALQSDFTKSYYLYGTAGSGKTFIALQIVKKFLDSLHTDVKDIDYDINETSYVKFMSWSSLIDTARKTFGDDEYNRQNRYELKNLKEIGFLVIDDLGTEKNTEFVDSVLYDFINYRYENQLQTIFTSNFTLDEIKEKYHSRIADRILGLCGKDNIREMKGKSKRSEMSQEKINIEIKKKQPSFQKRVERTPEEIQNCFDSFIKGLTHFKGRSQLLDDMKPEEYAKFKSSFWRYAKGEGSIAELMGKKIK